METKVKKMVEKVNLKGNPQTGQNQGNDKLKERKANYKRRTLKENITK